MPRAVRCELPGVPLHVTHRGVNRCAVFVDDEDRRSYLLLLCEQLPRLSVALHAYALMDIACTCCARRARPGPSLGPCAMPSRRMRTFNQSDRRTGTLWEGRFKSCLGDSDRYLLSIIRHIELDPVRAGMVAHPRECCSNSSGSS